MSQAAVRIGQHWVGADHEPFIIAEVSANHNNSLDRALEIVSKAAENGAHAIKLQTFTPATLTLNSHKPEFFIDDPKSLWHGRRLWELYEEAQTPYSWHEPIFDKARRHGMACISSAFDDSAIDFLVRLGVDAIKIASFELVHIPLIAHAAATRLPVILSTGMATTEEITDAVTALRGNSCDQFVLLRCTSAYPAEEKDANIISLTDLRQDFDCQVGLSDHCLSPYASYAAVALGATVIEKHITLSRADGGLDAAFSLEPAELKMMADGIRLVWLSRGKQSREPLAVELTSYKERPSIYVTRSMNSGDTFTHDNIRIVRPGCGLHPKHYYRILGRRAAVAIAADSALDWSLIADDSNP